VEQNGIQVVAARGSVTDFYTDLQGVQPRGWDAGRTWDEVPGVARGRQIVIATTGQGTAQGTHVPVTGEGHGSYNMTLHEIGHGVDSWPGSSSSNVLSQRPDFLAARQLDANTLSTYESQAGGAGPSETYAESFARFYGDDPTFPTERPNLYRLFQAWDQHWQGSPPPAPSANAAASGASPVAAGVAPLPPPSHTNGILGGLGEVEK